MEGERLLNYVGGKWRPSVGTEYQAVRNPATGETLVEVPLSTAADIDQAVRTARLAFEGWRRTPPTDRIQYLFRFKQLIEARFDEIAATITKECGKTLVEARGELRRGVENVEVATGIPSLMMGANLEDVATGIDEFMIRQPIGVVAAITPFNFPSMIPLWFLPYAIACGNTFILKPSEKVPLTTTLLFELLDQTALPPGIVSLVNGGKEAVDALIDHPDIRAISFVGSSAVAKYVYGRTATNGKRAQCQGGAKNPVVVLPDADMELTTGIVGESAFGCAGQRCLAASLAITVGSAQSPFEERIANHASSVRVGYGLDATTQMGPVISQDSKTRIEQLLDRAVKKGARLLVDGRNPRVPGFEQGNFLRPTILDLVDSSSEISTTEIFGPVLCLVHVRTVDEAIQWMNQSGYGNMASLFTSSGAAARQFRYEVQAGNIGINVGVAAPMAFFPFSGWKESFFGDLHAQGRDSIDFYTEKKVVVERWPRI